MIRIHVWFVLQFCYYSCGKEVYLSLKKFFFSGPGSLVQLGMPIYRFLGPTVWQAISHIGRKISRLVGRSVGR